MPELTDQGQDLLRSRSARLHTLEPAPQPGQVDHTGPAGLSSFQTPGGGAVVDGAGRTGSRPAHTVTYPTARYRPDQYRAPMAYDDEIQRNLQAAHRGAKFVQRGWTVVLWIMLAPPLLVGVLLCGYLALR